MKKIFDEWLPVGTWSYAHYSHRYDGVQHVDTGVFIRTEAYYDKDRGLLDMTITPSVAHDVAPDWLPVQRDYTARGYPTKESALREVIRRVNVVAEDVTAAIPAPDERTDAEIKAAAMQERTA